MQTTTQHDLRPDQSGFTLIELLTVVGIIALLLAILLPVLFGVRNHAQATACLSNVRQLSAALTMYTSDHEGFFPPAISDNGNWDRAIYSYVTDRHVFRCPSCPVPQTYDVDVPGLPLTIAKGYALNWKLYNANVKNNPAIADVAVQYPAETVSVCEVAFRSGPQPGLTSVFINRDSPDDGSDLLPGQSFIGSPGALRHQDGSNYAFVDGHVHWYRPGRVAGAKQTNNGQQPSFSL